MFKDWLEHIAPIEKLFGGLGRNRPKMLQAYGALEQAAVVEALDAKTRELIAITVAITTYRKNYISMYTATAAKTGAADSEIADALATTVPLNAGAAYVYTLCALEAVETRR